MSIRVKVANERATAYMPFSLDFVKTIGTLSGRKTWERNSVSFEANGANIAALKASGAAVEIEYAKGEIDAFEQLQSYASQHGKGKKLALKYKPAVKLFPHQEECLALCWDRAAYAVLLEMGLGKTSIILHNIIMLAMQRGLRGALIVAPKGVDDQWIDEAIPKHVPKDVRINCIRWKKKPIRSKDVRRGAINFFFINTDALRTERGKAACLDFIEFLGGQVLMAVDESQDIKSFTAGRTEAAIGIGQHCKWRRIATGTPIAKSLEDAFAQFYFLDRRILGHNYITSFRSEYCVMDKQRRFTVASKNVEKFYSLIAPHAFRKTKKECLNLPDKIYSTHRFEMSQEAVRIMMDLREQLMSDIDEGIVTSASNALVAVLRMQQVACGWVPTDSDDGAHIADIDDHRLKALGEIIESTTGQVIIWARFTHDVERIAAYLGKHYGKSSYVTYTGAVKAKKTTRDAAKSKFKSGECRFWVGNQQAGGSGLDLQGDDRTVVYYSNSQRSLDRWQSEDRAHRIGMGKDHLRIIDLVAVGSPDASILANLKRKKSLSDLSLDEIRKMIA